MMGPLEVSVGLVVVALTLRDVFDTVIVPGESQGSLRVLRRMLSAFLPVWKYARRSRPGISTSFGPFALVAAFVTWMLLLLFSFGAMAHGLGQYFSPSADSYAQGVFIAGTSLAAIGPSGIQASGLARWVIVASGFCGLAVLTMAVTYLIQMHQGISNRDATVLKITTTAGEPPSALAILERYATLDCRTEIGEVLRNGREWCSSVHQSHASHPSLIYFRSVGAGAGWPATLGALIDLALIAELLMEETANTGTAVLLRQEGVRLLQDINRLIGLKAGIASTTAADVLNLSNRLSAAGYTVRCPIDAAEFARRRCEHAAAIQAIASHLGTSEAPLLRTRGGLQRGILDPVQRS